MAKDEKWECAFALVYGEQIEVTQNTVHCVTTLERHEKAVIPEIKLGPIT